MDAGAVGWVFGMDPLEHLASSRHDRILRSAAANAAFRLIAKVQGAGGSKGGKARG